MTKVVNQSILLGSICAAAIVAAGMANAQEVKNAPTSMAATAAVTPVSQEQLSDAAKDGSNFLATNGNYEQTRFYPNDQINRNNVAHLHPAWIFTTEVKELLETSPIIVNGVMYVTTSFSHVYALDAKTGQEIWHFKPKLGPVTTFCCGPNNRGVAVYDDKVYVETLELEALRSRRKIRRRRLASADRRSREGIQRDGPPTAVDGKILIGTTRRRIRHPRLRSAPMTPRTASLSGTSTPPPRIRSAYGRPRTRLDVTSIATSRPKRRR